LTASAAAQREATRYEYQPVKFFLLTYAVTWIPWFVTAYLSYHGGTREVQHVLFFLGGFGPTIVALSLIFTSDNPALRRDFWTRLTNLQIARGPCYVIALLLFPALSVASVMLSLLFGRSIQQLTVVGNLLAWLPLMFLAPACEEIGWRGYGVDSLRARLGTLGATLVFGVLWALWHAPLFFINHTYQHDVWLSGPIYVFNFFAGIVPVAVIFNWLYYKANRSIPVIMLVHFSANVTPETFNIEQYTKLLALPVLYLLATLLVIVDWKTFREGPKSFLATAHH
jgi:membrane protease YdiL (CAAX protease family)